jgi:cell shape-determining protein MreC
MYRIKTPAGDTFLTEKVTYVRQHTSGVYLITDQANAEGVNHNGVNYRYDEGTQVHEVDAAEQFVSVEKMVQAIKEGVNDV